ncbi:MAG TPA: glycerol kinase GlpK [Actinomycetota bacterium]|jgi:glycerol kinase|nr:glycerol kinase GlpK [Actinomycetota bacterium]
MAELVCAIDAGTTGITVLVLDADARVRGRAYSEFTQHFPRPGWVEHDAEEIWEVTRGVLGAALEDAGASGSDLAAIGITNQRETAVLWDRKTGQPVAGAVVWQCRRSAAICERLRSEGLEDELRRRTGLVLDPYFSASKIIWLLDNVDGARGRAEAGELAFGTIDTWLIWKLTGGEVHVTEPGNASRTMLYSLAERKWDPWILDRLDIPASLLPDVRRTSGRFGATSSSLLGGAEVPISGAAGDQQAALFGQACFERGMAKNTYGTGSFVLVNTGADPAHSERGLLATAAWDVGGGVEYALEGAIFTTGAAIQWLRDGLGVISEAAETGPLAASVDDSGGTYLVPAFVGLGAPHWDPYARGTWIGITQGTTKAHLARAVVEAMAFQTRDVVEAMVADSGAPLQELRVDGGASVMDVLCQFQADLLGAPVRRPANQETTALGAAYLAGLDAGVWSSREEIAAKWAVAAEYEPRMGRDEADARYAEWREALDRSRAWARAE